jgi:hypothetical protein
MTWGLHFQRASVLFQPCEWVSFLAHTNPGRFSWTICASNFLWRLSYSMNYSKTSCDPCTKCMIELRMGRLYPHVIPPKLPNINSMEQSSSRQSLIVAQPVKKFSPFMEPEGSLLCSQEPTSPRVFILSQMNPVHTFP